MPSRAARHERPNRTGAAVCAAVCAALVMAACGREPSSIVATSGVVRSEAIAFVTEFPQHLPAFQAAGGGGVEFTKVRIVLNNPDGSVALDTVVNFPAGATELQLTLAVPLPANAPASGVPLGLNLDYQNAAGQTVFHGGPVTVNAVPAKPGAGPPPPAPVTIPISYTGPGSNATGVRISPRTLSVNTGQAFAFSAQATDANGNVIPNTPIVFSSQNTGLATINAATGAGTAGAVRGTVGIVAQLLTGPTDGATLTIISPPALLALASGSGQTGPVSATLKDPVVVRATAADGGPAAGVTVTFAAANGGTATPSSATTDANGLAQASWKLGTAAGPQTLQASAAGLGGSPFRYTATATPVDPVRVVVATEPPGSATAGLGFGFVVNAVTAIGTVATTFSGPVTVALPSGTAGGVILGGTTTVNAVAGVATFAGLTINRTGTFALAVTAPSLTGTNTAPVQVSAGPASRLVFQNYPIAGATAGVTLDPVTVEARDALGNVATTFTGAVTVTDGAALLASPSRARIGWLLGGASAPAFAIGGTTTVSAVAGVATFGTLVMTEAGSRALGATSSGLTAAAGPTFVVSPGAASGIAIVGGDGQSAAGGATLPVQITVKVADRYGNGVAGRTVTFTAGSGGSANPASATTSADGTARTTWTLGSAAGAQTLTVASSGLGSATATASASGGGGGGASGSFVIIHDVNWLDASYGTPYAGNVQFLKNLVNVGIGGTRSSANKVLLFDFQTLTSYTFSYGWSGAASIVQGEGYVTAESTNRPDLSSIASDVRVLILHAPNVTFTTAEVNAFKSFISQGGRILYIGENSGFQYTLDAADALIAAMGGSTSSVPACVFENLATQTAPLTAGVAAAGALSVACASYLVPGTGDVVLFKDAGGHALVVQVSVSTAPIIALQEGGGLRAPAPGAAIRIDNPGSATDPTIRPPR